MEEKREATDLIKDLEDLEEAVTKEIEVKLLELRQLILRVIKFNPRRFYRSITDYINTAWLYIDSKPFIPVFKSVAPFYGSELKSKIDNYFTKTFQVFDPLEKVNIFKYYQGNQKTSPKSPYYQEKYHSLIPKIKKFRDTHFNNKVDWRLFYIYSSFSKLEKDFESDSESSITKGISGEDHYRECINSALESTLVN